MATSAAGSERPENANSSANLKTAAEGDTRFCTKTRVGRFLLISLLFFLMMVAQVVNKVCCIWIIGGSTIHHTKLQTWYAAMGVLLVAPEVVGLVKVIWHTSFIKRTRTHKWPGGLALIVGLLVSFAEAATYAVFSLEVAPRLPVYVLIPMTSAVFAMSLSHEQWQHLRNTDADKLPAVEFDVNFTLSHKEQDKNSQCRNGHHHSSNNWKRVIRTVFGLSGVWCSCAISGIVALTSRLPWFHALCLPACLCLLSLCWHPRVQTYIIKSADGSYSGRWKATCVYTLTKIVVLLFGINIDMVIRLRRSGVLDTDFFLKLWQGFLSCSHPEIMYPLIGHFSSSILVHVIGYMGCTLGSSGTIMSLPFVTTTPLTVAVCVLMCLPELSYLDDPSCYHVGTGIWCACGLALITWLAPLVIRGRDLNKPTDALLKPYEELFIQPTWNSVFLEQHMSLNYKWDGFSSTLDQTSTFSIDPTTRIFMCTTMYREADVEMGRLLASLNKVAMSKKLKNIYLEAHIFLDSGTSDLHITDFASQLVSLLHSKMGVKVGDANAHVTPYGVQLSWKLPSGMPFFIHMKDESKVKSKKRWSQVMYMSYVLNYRVMKDITRVQSQETEPEPCIPDSIFVGYASEKEWRKNTVTLTCSSDLIRERARSTPHLASVDNTTHSLDRNVIATKLPKFLLARKDQISSDAGGTMSSNNFAGSVATSMTSLEPTELGIQTSSDTGLGQSDSFSLSSTGILDHGDSSDPGASWRGSRRRRRAGVGGRRGAAVHAALGESLREYEGDVSSNNESSLTQAHRRRWQAHSRRTGECLQEGPGQGEGGGVQETPSRVGHARERGRGRKGKGGLGNDGNGRQSAEGLRRIRHTGQYHSSHSLPRHTPHLPRHHGDDYSLHHHQQQQQQQHSHQRSRRHKHEFRSCRPHHRAQRRADLGSRHELHTSPTTPTTSSSHPNLYESLDSQPTPFAPLSRAGYKLLSRSDPGLFPKPPSERGTPLPDPLNIPLDDHTYILATDADMEFTDSSVIDLLNVVNYDKRLGGACGRTHPVGQTSGPLVWYQKFEYAKDFWMIKSAQNVIGSVMCCPGCFSLYRAGAVRDVLASYASPTTQPFDVFIKDTGEDRWLCTLMMLNGWKLEYTAFCDNTTFCPDSFQEFMKQRRRWVLSDIANMLLVFKNVFKLIQRNDSFSIAYILYLAQMFTIVLLSPASTIVILAGGLDIVYGLPFELAAPLLGVIILTYALVCIVGNVRTQVRLTLALTLVLGAAMMLVVVGGSVFIVQDIVREVHTGSVAFQEYHLILLLVAGLVLAALAHPRETGLLAHGLSYLGGFPAMQILLPVYAVCNIVDQSWGTREKTESNPPPVSCFALNRNKYHKTLSRKTRPPVAEPQATSASASSSANLPHLHHHQPQQQDQPPAGEVDAPDAVVGCPWSGSFRPLSEGGRRDEHVFWQRLRGLALGRDTNLGLSGLKLADGLRTLRNVCVLALLVLNTLWLVLLSVLYFNADVSIARLNVYGLIAGAVYGLVLLVQLVGMTVHRVQAIFRRVALKLYGRDSRIWVHSRTAN